MIACVLVWENELVSLEFDLACVPRAGEAIRFIDAAGKCRDHVVDQVVHEINQATGEHVVKVYHSQKTSN